MADRNLSDKYQLDDVPFTRSARPLIGLGQAEHALEKHSFDSPKCRNISRFPKGTFGPDDNDVYIAKELIDNATYKGEPVWANKIRTALYFYENIGGVPSRIPVRLNDDGIWETRTAHPLVDWGVH